MNVSFGEKLVNVEIEDLRKKLRGNGGKNLGPGEKVKEINGTIDRINRIRHNQKTDAFFSTEKFKVLMQGLEGLRNPSII